MVPNCSCEVAGCDLTCKQFGCHKEREKDLLQRVTKILGDGPERIGP